MTEFGYDQSWSRKHDLRGAPHIAHAPVTAYVTSLEDVIALCRDHPPDQRLHAAGTHWALSPAAVSDHTFIETNDPRNQHDAMARSRALAGVFVEDLEAALAEFAALAESLRVPQ
jgi:hypothetical protein